VAPGEDKIAAELRPAMVKRVVSDFMVFGMMNSLDNCRFGCDV
jgi:hypothetical protein